MPGNTVTISEELSTAITSLEAWSNARCGNREQFTTIFYVKYNEDKALITFKYLRGTVKYLWKGWICMLNR